MVFLGNHPIDPLCVGTWKCSDVECCAIYKCPEFYGCSKLSFPACDWSLSQGDSVVEMARIGCSQGR